MSQTVEIRNFTHQKDEKKGKHGTTFLCTQNAHVNVQVNNFSVFIIFKMMLQDVLMYFILKLPIY